LATELDLRYHSVGRRIDHKVSPPRFVRDEDSPLPWSIRDPVRESRSRYPRHDLERGIIHHDNSMVPRCRGIRPVFRGHGQDAGHRRKPVQISDDSPGAYVEDHELSGAHVRNEQPPGCGREALVVEARRAPRQRYIGDHAEGRLRRRRRRNGARPMGLDRWTGERASWRRHLRCRGERHAVSVRVSISHPPYGVRRCTTLTTNAPLSGRASAPVSGKRNRASGSVVYPEFHTTNTSSPITGIQWNRRLKSTRSLSLSSCTNASRLVRVVKSYSNRLADNTAVNAPTGNRAVVVVRSVLTMRWPPPRHAAVSSRSVL